MAYVKQNFVKGQILTAEHMNHIEDGIVAAADAQSLGGVAAGNYALKTDVAPDSNMLGGKAPAYYLQPRNLLDNSDFTNPVNQRGASSYTTAGDYGIDRWFLRTSSSVTVNSGSITVTGKMKQRLLNAAQGGTYTLAAGKADGSVTILTTHGWDNDASCYYVELPAGEYVWVALYEGSYTADTLPPYVPKGYAAELAECMRYFQTIPYYFAQNSVNTNSNYPSYFPIQFFPMRIAPTVTLNESWNSNMISKTTREVTTRSFSIGFVLDSTSNGYLQWNGNIILSADL